MANKKKAIPGTAQFNKMISELPEKEKIQAHVKFRRGLVESQKELIIIMNLIDCKELNNNQDYIHRLKQERKNYNVFFDINEELLEEVLQDLH